jgi:hypothetical protein
MSIQLYNLIHVFGVIVLFMALGGTIVHVINGGTKESNTWRKPLAMMHGIALFLIFLGGFGLMARLGISHVSPPGWIWAKFVIWLLLGAAIALPYRVKGLAKPFALVLPLLGALATWLGVFKPF